MLLLCSANATSHSVVSCFTAQTGQGSSVPLLCEFSVYASVKYIWAVLSWQVKQSSVYLGWEHLAKPILQL